MWWIVMSAAIVSLTKATTSAAGIHGAPSLAVISDGPRSAGWTATSARTLRRVPDTQQFLARAQDVAGRVGGEEFCVILPARV